jgi:hypothetical protein
MNSGTMTATRIRNSQSRCVGMLFRDFSGEELIPAVE